jgi:uncharacterized protein (TIGR02646 family)
LIHIDRNRTDAAGRTVIPDGSWFDLSKKWTDTAVEEGSAHAVRESVYRHESVKKALEELFYRKCAYCETPLPEVDWQVEHFRPKGRVAERADHPGYYWLAYTWTNLYPSCAACNQNREDKPLWDDPVSGTTEGKADQFPIEDEALRALGPEGDLASERPLLLDPCADDPEQSFRYTPLGEIEPLSGDARAEASIRIFHLTRRRLRDRRREQIKTVVGLLRLLRSRRQINDPNVASLERDITEIFFSDTAPFAGAARLVRNDPDAFAV